MPLGWIRSPAPGGSEFGRRQSADATGGTLARVERRSPGESYLSEDAVRAMIASARAVPARFELSPEDAAQWPRFEPFVSWEHARALEAEEDAEEKLEEEEEPEG